MKLTTKGRYAVMAMTDLAAYGTQRPVAIADMAVRQGVASSYLEQLLMKLRRAGLVEATRGRTGGYRLGRDAESVRLSEIVAAAEETIRTTRCEPGSREGCLADGTRCLTHDLWDALGERIQDFFASVTLADVVAGRVAPSKPAPAAMPEAAE